MNTPRGHRLLLRLTAAAWASPPDLKLQADPPIGLAGYRTFEWASAAPAADSTLSERARAAVARGFGALGLAGAPPGEIAVAVSLHAPQTESQLAIDIYDARSQRVIWRGLAAGRVNPDNDADIARMVSALLAHASL